MKFDDALIDEVVKLALKHHIAPAALMAVVEVESAGRALEEDGKTPRLLFERHVFHRELSRRRPDRLRPAIAQGLAIPRWSRATQYRDQGSSHGRLVVLSRARAIDEDCANRACSWGVGQTMGFLAEGQGFRNANEMVRHMIAGGVPAQVECMVREIKNRKLDVKLNRHDWAGFARAYNGPGYAQNQYDVKMAAAYGKWMRRLVGRSAAGRSAAARTVTPMSEVPAPVPEPQPIDLPPTRNAEPPKTPARSRTIWSAIVAALLAVGGAAASHPTISVAVALGVVALAAFIIYDRRKKLVENHV
jgi:N-acetylmuramidase